MSYKTIFDLTHSEVITLDTPATKLMHNRFLVDNGVALHAPQKLLPPEPPVFEGTAVTLYAIGGIVTRSAESATEICKFLNTFEPGKISTQYRYDSNLEKFTGINHTYDDNRGVRPLSVETQMCMSQEDYTRFLKVLNKYNEDNKAYSGNGEEYDTWQERYDAVTSVFNTYLRWHRTASSRLETLHATFDDYQQVAGGDAVTAFAFLEKISKFPNPAGGVIDDFNYLIKSCDSAGADVNIEVLVDKAIVLWCRQMLIQTHAIEASVVDGQVVLYLNTLLILAAKALLRRL